MSGRLYGIGVGPGDPELISVKAYRVIKDAEVIALPSKEIKKCTAYSIIKDFIEEIADKKIMCIDIPMTRDLEVLNQAYFEGAKRIEHELQEGNNVAFLNLGDPMLYGSYIRLHNNVIKDGYEAEIISGVNSFSAVATKLGMAIGERHEAIHIIPGTYADGKFYELIKQYVANGDSIVIMKSSKSIDKIKTDLIMLEEEKLIAVGAVTDCGMPNEYIAKGAHEIKDDAGYFTTIIVKPFE